MAKITLKPLDDGQRPVEIPVGKTTIGRGPFLGCSDKKVSRNHAVLEVTSKGEVFLTPTHVNPCFYQPTADSPGQILKKDIPHKLENGDTFSLLPRAFRYQLIVQGDKDQEKLDQKELNKAKTNGSTGKCDAILNERNKDLKKGISNEELNDGNTVTEKPFSKDDHILSDSDKNCSKEENSLAKKSASAEEEEEEEEEEDAEDDSKSHSAKASNEDFEKEKTETNSISQKEDKLESDRESGDKKDGKDDSQDNDESCAEDKAECDKPKFSEKIVEENESTLGNDTFAKDKMDSVQPSEKVDSKEKSDEKKTEVNASNGDENLDSNPDVPLQFQFSAERLDIESGDSDEAMPEAPEKIKETVRCAPEGNVKDNLNGEQEITIIATPYNENERSRMRKSVVKNEHKKSKLFDLDDSNLEISLEKEEENICEIEEEEDKAEGKENNILNREQEITTIATPYNENERSQIRKNVAKNEYKKSKLFDMDDSNLEISLEKEEENICEIEEEEGKAEGKENGLFDADNVENDVYEIEDDENDICEVDNQKENDMHEVDDDQKKNGICGVDDQKENDVYEKENDICEVECDKKENDIYDVEDDQKENEICEIEGDKKEKDIYELKVDEKEDDINIEGEKENRLSEAGENEKESSMCEADKKENSLCEAEQDMNRDDCKSKSTVSENETVVENGNVNATNLNMELLDKENKFYKSAQCGKKYIIEDIIDIASDESNSTAAKELTIFENGEDVVCESRHSSETSGKDDEWTFQQEIQDIVNEETEKVCQMELSQIGKENENSHQTSQAPNSSIEDVGDLHKKDPDIQKIHQESDESAEPLEPGNESTITATTNSVLVKKQQSLHEARENMDETCEVTDKWKDDLLQNETFIDNAMKDVSSPLSATSKALKSRKRKFSEVEEDAHMRELVETNRKIAENLKDIGREIKRRNDLLEEANKLQEIVIRLKEKKLKLMHITANVKDD